MTPDHMEKPGNLGKVGRGVEIPGVFTYKPQPPTPHTRARFRFTKKQEYHDHVKTY